MNGDGEYLVPAGPGESTLVEKRSKFLARVWPVDDEEAALRHIDETRRRHWDATHNVYAYVIRNGPTRYSDDGEPQGTSGLPTLNVFRQGGVFNVCCVVTRYYGGILLGAGGLVRAYSTAAKTALEQAGTGVMRRWHVILLPCPYALLEQAKKLAAAAGGVVQSAEYGVDVLLEILVPVATAESFAKNVLDASAGTVEPEIMDTVFRCGPA